MTVSLFLGKEEVQMQKAQYGILRFAKYKGPEISNIEAHNERTKERCICGVFSSICTTAERIVSES